MNNELVGKPPWLEVLDWQRHGINKESHENVEMAKI
jgi:hypothetical protein